MRAPLLLFLAGPTAGLVMCVTTSAAGVRCMIHAEVGAAARAPRGHVRTTSLVICHAITSSVKSVDQNKSLGESTSPTIAGATLPDSVVR